MTGYYLLEHPNPAAPDRGDGRYWGYAEMLYRPQAIVIHTAESIADEIGDDLGAEAIANYFATGDRPASYHTIVDSDSAVRLLPAGLDAEVVHTAFHTYGYNSKTVGISIAMRADSWGTVSGAWAAKALNRLVNEAAALCARWDIPVVYRTRAEIDGGAKGFTSHAQLDPGARTDPGDGFPWTKFMALVSAQLTLGPSTTEDDMLTPAQEAKLDRVLDVAEQVATGQLTGAIVRELDGRFNTIGSKLDVLAPGAAVDLTAVPTSALVAELLTRNGGRP